MFEDIISKKFEGVNIGARNIESEIRAVIMMAADFAINEMKSDPETVKVLKSFFDKNLDEMVQIYLDYFEPEELLEMLTFEMSEAARKKLRFQMKIQQFMGDKIVEILVEKDEKDNGRDKYLNDMFKEEKLQEHKDLISQWEQDKKDEWSTE